MTMLWIFVLLASAGWLWLCLRRPAVSALAQEDQARKALSQAQYRAALEQVENDLRSGALDAAEAERQKAEAGFQLVQALEKNGPSGDWVARLGLWPRLILFVLPLGAAFFAFDATQGRMHWPAADSAAAAEPDVEAMVAGLAARLQQNPDDQRGWMMLGRSYMVMQRFAEAAKAFEQANARSPSPDPDLLVAEAEALAMSRDQDLEGRPERLLEQALTVDPQNMRALWYAGLAASSRNDRATALARFEQLAALPDLPAELRAALAEMGLGAEPEPVATDGAYAIKVALELAPALRQQAPPGSTLFVFAREAGGPPMPLAVARLEVGTFPQTVTLDESMGMLPGRDLATVPRLEIVARISQSGAAAPQSGDWSGQQTWENSPTGGSVSVVIDQILP